MSEDLQGCQYTCTLSTTTVQHTTHTHDYSVQIRTTLAQRTDCLPYVYLGSVDPAVLSERRRGNNKDKADLTQSSLLTQ